MGCICGKNNNKPRVKHNNRTNNPPPQMDEIDEHEQRIIEQQIRQIQEMENQPAPSNIKPLAIHTELDHENIKFRESKPMGILEQIYPYCCPICLKYYNLILKLTCCGNYVCLECLNDIEQQIMNEKIQRQCWWCRSEDFEIEDVQKEENLKVYSDVKMLENTNKDFFNKIQESKNFHNTNQDARSISEFMQTIKSVQNNNPLSIVAGRSHGAAIFGQRQPQNMESSQDIRASSENQMNHNEVQNEMDNIPVREDFSENNNNNEDFKDNQDAMTEQQNKEQNNNEFRLNRFGSQSNEKEQKHSRSDHMNKKSNKNNNNNADEDTGIKEKKSLRNQSNLFFVDQQTGQFVNNPGPGGNLSKTLNLQQYNSEQKQQANFASGRGEQNNNNNNNLARTEGDNIAIAISQFKEQQQKENNNDMEELEDENKLQQRTYKDLGEYFQQGEGQSIQKEQNGEQNDQGSNNPINNSNIKILDQQEEENNNKNEENKKQNSENLEKKEEGNNVEAEKNQEENNNA